MSAQRKNKLSLKKAVVKKPDDAKVKPENTILSMFQHQTYLPKKEVRDAIIVESGSEGDVVVTKIVGSISGTVFPVDVPDHNTKDNKVETEKLKTGKNKKRLSLSKGKKQAADNGDEVEEPSNKRKKQKLSHTENLKINLKLKDEEQLNENQTGSDNDAEVSDSQSQYKLRRCKTVPKVDKSENESDKDIEAIPVKKKGNGNVSSKTNKERKNHKDIDSSDDDFSVIIIEDEKRTKGKRKLSLKKSKTESDVSKSKIRKTSKSNKKIIKIKSEPRLDIIDLEEIKPESQDSNIVELKNKTTIQSNGDCSRSVKVKEEDNTKKIIPAMFLKRKSVADKNDLKNVPQNKTVKPDMNVQLSKKNKSTESDKNSSVVKTEGLTIELLSNKTDAPTDCKGETASQSKSEEIENTLKQEDDTTKAEEPPEEETYRIPYYLENFRTIQDNVLGDERNVKLFNSHDMEYFAAFNQLDEPSQKLYIRIFSRKISWLPMSKLKYPEIGDDIPALVDELVAQNLLRSGDLLTDLSIVIKSLAAPDLKLLAKSFHINSTGLTKQKMTELLMKKSQQNSISSMFTGGASISTGTTMLNRAKSYLGKVCRLHDDCRAVFIRVLMLFNLYHTNFDEDNNIGGQNQLFQMLMANIGRVVYPSYTVNRLRCIFIDREAVVRFERALQFEIDIQGKIEKNKWAEAHDIYKQAKLVGDQIQQNADFRGWDSDLPEYLRIYTAGSVYTRIDNLGVEILQKLKLYRTAVELLEGLVDQRNYCIHYRGHWYERLALNLDAHLKSPEKSLAVCERGLLDQTVRSGRRLALYERAKKICEAPKSKFTHRLSDFDHDQVLPTPETYIDGMVISDATCMGLKLQFIMQGDTESTTMCGVEELVLDYYKQHGYPEGLHAEGSVVSNLFVLLCWDIMFMDVVDVFQGQYQTCPLDMYTQDFYISRKSQVDERLAWLRQASIQELCDEIGDVWEKHNGTMCIGISWDKFITPDTHQGLVMCMGGVVIADILERYVKDPRHTRSGFPDLTLWNTDTKAFKICEVKSPSDRLSYKQILWIDYLLKHGVDAEVCHVKAVGSKKLKPSSSSKPS